MTWLADAHRDWHYAYGNVTCPLDCGIGEFAEPDPRDVLDFGGTIRCGNCKDIHPDVANVRLCHDFGPWTA